MPSPEPDQLLADYLAGVRDPDLVHALADAVERDPALRRRLADALAVERMLRQAGAGPLDADCVLRALPVGSDEAMQDRVLARHSSLERGARRRLATGRLIAAAASLVIAACLGALALRHPPAPPGPPVLAVLRDTHDALWTAKPPAIDGSRRLAAGQLELASGLAEIAFADGASVVMEGPAVLELESAGRARLLRGRVTAHVPFAARGFTIAAKDLEVVDLGTEFGIAFGHDGCADVQVFQGTVDAGLVGAAAPAVRSRLGADQAVRLDPHARVIAPIAPDEARFVRSLRPRSLVLDLADLVSDGDGRGTGVREGLDPLTGRITDAAPLGLRRGDNAYHRTLPSGFIDGVFVPNGSATDTIVSSQLHRFRFPATDGQFYDLVRRGGTLESPQNGGTPSHPKLPPVFGGIDYDSPGHTCVGMHANIGFTLDLRALGAARGMRVSRFTAQVANIGRKGGDKGMVDFWLLVDGRMLAHYAELTASSGPVAVDLLLHEGDRFLTLASTDSGNGVGLDWLTLGDPRLHLTAGEIPR